jgi:hypothetical protein
MSNQIHTPMPEPQGAERRSESRFSHFTLLTVHVPTSDDAPESTRPVEAWCQTASGNGVSFLSTEHFTARCVHLESSHAQGELVEVEIVRCRELISGLWEYGGFVFTKVSP